MYYNYQKNIVSIRMSEIATHAKMMTVNPALRRVIKLKKGSLGSVKYVAPVAESEDLMDTDVKYIQTEEAKKEVSETDKDKKALKVIIAWLRGNQKNSDKYKSSGSGKRYSIPYWKTGGDKMLEAGNQLNGKTFTDPSDKEAFFNLYRESNRIEMLGPKENTFLHWADILESKR